MEKQNESTRLINEKHEEINDLVIFLKNKCKILSEITQNKNENEKFFFENLRDEIIYFLKKKVEDIIPTDKESLYQRKKEKKIQKINNISVGDIVYKVNYEDKHKHTFYRVTDIEYNVCNRPWRDITDELILRELEVGTETTFEKECNDFDYDIYRKEKKTST